jgi:hypothetical protein
VYAVRPMVPVPLARETAALLACGPNALLSHGSAASLWKLCERGGRSRRAHRHPPASPAHAGPSHRPPAASGRVARGRTSGHLPGPYAARPSRDADGPRTRAGAR